MELLGASIALAAVRIERRCDSEFRGAKEPLTAVGVFSHIPLRGATSPYSLS